MVRRFDANASTALVRAYADIVESAQAWLNERPHLARLVRVEQPTEVGSDFVARKFHVYLTRTNSYDGSPEAPEVPEELEQMQTIFREEAGHPWDSRDAILERILSRSILEPSGKTYPGEPLDGSPGTQFVIVDPKITRQDLDEWLRLFPQT